MAIDRKTELANSVAVGADGWLFHRDNCTFEQLSQAKPFSLRDLRRWGRLLELRYQWLKAHGAEYYFLVIPEKHVVYPEMLPPGSKISDQRPVMQLASYLDGNAYGPKMIYPISSLVSRKSELPTFWSAGSHFNSFGAYWAYRDLCEVISRNVALPRVLALEDFKLEICRHSGDLGVRLDPEPAADEHLVMIKNPAAVKVFDNRIYARGATAVFEHPNKRLPRAVFFRDSATSWLYPFLAESFSRLVLVSSTSVFFDLVEAEQPDIVVTEVIERYLDEPTELPDDLDCRTFEDLCRCSVSAVAAAHSKLRTLHGPAR